MKNKINCPYHQDSTASLHLYQDGNYYCFGCARYGSIDELTNQIGQNLEPPKGEKYVENIEESIRRIKSYPIGSIRGLAFHFDSDGYYIVWPDNSYYCKRYFEASSERGKYKAPSGHRRPLLVANGGLAKCLIVVEGEINALSIAEVCPEIAVVSPGSAGEFYSKSGQLNLPYYELYDNIFLLADSDSAGAKACIELKSTLLTRNVNKQIFIKLMEKDANQILIENGKETLRQVISDTIRQNMYMPELI